MRQFTEVNPITAPSNPSLVESFDDISKPDRTFFILIDEGFAIIFVRKWFTNRRTGESKWQTYQLELPKAGIPWIVNTLENKFLKLSHEGGLPTDVRHYEEVVDGEKLGIGREMNLGSNGQKESGYSLTTLSRKSNWDTPKELSFSDSFLFEHGFF